MTTLYELTGTFKRINDTEGLDEETKADTLESIDWSNEFEEKVENTAKVIKNKEASKKLIKEEIDRLTARYKSLDNDVAWLKRSMQEAFEVTGPEKVKGLLFTVYMAKNQPSVIVDENLLPKKYFVIAKKPDKNAIKELLNAGKKVKGATLQESRSLRIK